MCNFLFIFTHTRTHARTHTHTHTRLTALFPGLPRWAGTWKVKPIWILQKQETVSGSSVSWAICKSAPHSRQITTPAPHRSVFTGRMPFLMPNQQHQSTEVVFQLIVKYSEYPAFVKCRQWCGHLLSLMQQLVMSFNSFFNSVFIFYSDIMDLYWLYWYV